MRRVTEKTLYVDYINDNPKQKLTFEDWYFIVKTFGDMVLEKILYESKVFIFPGSRMGFLAIIRIKNRFDKLLTGNLKEEHTTLKARVSSSIGTPKPFSRIFTYWDKRIKYCKFYRTKYYTFSWSGNNKKIIHQYIVESLRNPDMEPIDPPFKRV